MRIVFDFGGVLFHWHPEALVRRHLAGPDDDDLRAAALVREVFQGYGGDWALFDRGTVQVSELVHRITARTGLAAAAVHALVDAVGPSLTPKADTVALLSRLHAAGATLHFLSNMPLPCSEYLDRAHPALMACFRSGVYSSRVRLIKPEAALFRLAAERFDAPAQDLLLIDDHRDNVAAARAAGWQALHFSDAASCERELRANGWWPAA